MSAFLTKCVFTPDSDGATYTLDEPLIYHSDLVNADITVPTGFVTDLASVPRIFWDIFPPFGKYTQAAIIHDYIYKGHNYPRGTCDNIFLEAMIVLGVSWISRNIIWSQLRLWGWTHY